MTQPAVQPPPQDDNHVIESTTLALALIALEQQAHDDVDTTISNLYKGLAAAGLLAAASAPATTLTGLALISLPAFHTTTVALFNAARLKVADTVTASYQAAAHVAKTHVTDQMGWDPGDLPDLGTSLDTLLRDVETMFGHAQTELQNLVQAGYDPANPHKLGDTITNASPGLTARATAAATTAVQRGSTDAQQAIWTKYQTLTGTALLKRWRTTSSNPCGMCQALNGTTVGVNGDFNARATTKTKDLRPVWRNLSGPPRHPNCRCQLDLVTA